MPGIPTRLERLERATAEVRCVWLYVGWSGRPGIAGAGAGVYRVFVPVRPAALAPGLLAVLRHPGGAEVSEATATVRRKGHATIGVQSGTLLDPQRWRTTPRDITPRAAVWYYPSTGQTGDGCDGHARAFHAGHPLTGSPARPILGWTLGAQETCRRLVSEAVRAATVPDRR